MAIYHLSVKSVSRGEGRCATAAAAYRAAARILDRQTGQVFDYTRRHGVEHSEIVLSTHAAQQDINWPRNRQDLWNAAERAERRKDGRIAREYEVALPSELSRSERLELTRSFALEIANRYQCAVDVAIHRPHPKGDQRNHHAHLLATTREITPRGLGEKTAVEWSNSDRKRRGLPSASEEMIAIRSRWAALANERLRQHGRERIDHRSLRAQGIEREATVHKGPTITALERRGLAPKVEWQREEERRQEQQARLERAAEIGRLQRELVQVIGSILTLSTDIAAARRERDRARSNEKEHGREPRSGTSQLTFDRRREEMREARKREEMLRHERSKENERKRDRDRSR